MQKILTESQLCPRSRGSSGGKTATWTCPCSHGAHSLLWESESDQRVLQISNYICQGHSCGAPERSSVQNQFCTGRKDQRPQVKSEFMKRRKEMCVQRPWGTVPLGTRKKVQESRMSRGGWQRGPGQAPLALWDSGLQPQNTMERF